MFLPSILIYEHDQDGAHDRICEIPAVVQDGKIEVKWEYEYHEDTDEIGLLKVNNRESRFHSGSVGYTVLLTKDCNMRCPYCYRAHEMGAMSDEVADAFVVVDG